MTVQEAYKQLSVQLSALYEGREAAGIADRVIEYITGLRKIDRIINKLRSLNEEQLALLHSFTIELLQNKPVQYVLHEAWFAAMKFYVNEHVLIPRPETEELVEWISGDIRSLAKPVGRLLDIGTGSGCIPIALKKKFPAWEVHAVDVSTGALDVAKKNAVLHQAELFFYRLDILDPGTWCRLADFDIIVSNPPYVTRTEGLSMQKNVLEHEPHLALFVPDEDPLIFYNAIAAFALQHLNRDGKLYFEINETLAGEVKTLLMGKGFSEIELRKDVQGKDRMIKAAKPF